MTSEEIGTATWAANVECAWGDEENYDEEVADNGRTADGV
jgi:hypothetical protein